MATREIDEDSRFNTRVNEYSEEDLRKILEDDPNENEINHLTSDSDLYRINKKTGISTDTWTDLPEDLNAAIENGSTDKYLEKYTKSTLTKSPSDLDREMQSYLQTLEEKRASSKKGNIKEEKFYYPVGPTLKSSKRVEVNSSPDIHLASGIMSLVEIQQHYRSLQINELDLPATSQTSISAAITEMSKLQDELRIHINRLTTSSMNNPARYRKGQELLDDIEQEIRIYNVFISEKEGLSLERILSQVDEYPLHGDENGEMEMEDDDEEDEFRYTPFDQLHDDSISDVVPPSSITSTPGKRLSSQMLPMRHQPFATSRFDSPNRSFTSSIPPSSVADSTVIEDMPEEEERDEAWEMLRWISLKKLSRQLVDDRAKAKIGFPTVMAASGIIVVGTSRGFTLIFDYKQHLQCILGSQGDFAIENGSVTALAISADQTHVTVGHSSGAIHIWDLARPQTMSKSISPINIDQAAAGLKEGHVKGSVIIYLSFIGIRRALIVSADTHGMAFYHSTAKVVLVNAFDTIKILGRYPGLSGDFNTPVVPKPRRSSTVFGLACLPYGQIPHPVDNYGMVALLTPHKMVIVNTKPVVQTQFKVTRKPIPATLMSLCGALAWYPPVLMKEGTKKVETEPLLAYSWGSYLAILRIHAETFQSSTPERLAVVNGKKPKQIKLEYKTFIEWQAKAPIVALQWLNPKLLLILTSNEELVIFDVNAKAASDESSIRDLHVISHDRYSNDISNLFDPLTQVPSSAVPQMYSQSLKVYKGRLFLLATDGVMVGTLLSWADRVLALMNAGDYIEAISLTTSFYRGTPLQSVLNLPDNDQDRRHVVGDKLRQLILSSLNFAFTQSTSMQESPDDISSSLRELAIVCIDACIAMDDEKDLLYDEIYEKYNESKQRETFLLSLEPFILERKLKHIPPSVVQDLVRCYRDRHLLARAEQIICHLDPLTLDIDSVIQLSQREGLYDTMAFVYSRSLQDFVSPIVKFIGLMRRVLVHRRKSIAKQLENGDLDKDEIDEDAAMADYLDPKARKLYNFLRCSLTGLTYPAMQEILPPEEAQQAKSSIYDFVFSGRSQVWPKTGGQLVLTQITDDEDEGLYPYLRLFLRYDTKAFMDALDAAFEDSYLNMSVSRFDDMNENHSSKVLSRQMMISILLEIVKEEKDFNQASIVYMFVARNIPKYPQFILLSPSILQRILVSLCLDKDITTREERQLSVEYLLSGYSPPNRDEMLEIYINAKFYRVLEHAYKSARQYGDLFKLYLEDDEQGGHVLEIMDKTLSSGKVTQDERGQIRSFIMEHIHEIADLDGEGLARLVNTQFGEKFQEEVLKELEKSNLQLFNYLCGLFKSNEGGIDNDFSLFSPSSSGSVLQEKYITLLCEFDPMAVYDYLEKHQDAKIDHDKLITVCENHDLLDATIFLMTKSGKAPGALEKALDILEFRQEEVTSALSKVESPQLMSLNEVSASIRTEIDSTLLRLKDIIRIGVKVCSDVTSDSSSEDLWFNLLDKFLRMTKEITGGLVVEDKASESVGEEIMVCHADKVGEMSHNKKKETVVSYVSYYFKGCMGDILSSLLLSKSEPAVSFPKLFKRLVQADGQEKATFANFRGIFDGMLETYRYEGELLERTNGLYERDLFQSLQGVAKQRVRGWRPRRSNCEICGSLLWGSKMSPAMCFGYEQGEAGKLINGELGNGMQGVTIFRCGHCFHEKCLVQYTQVSDEDEDEENESDDDDNYQGKRKSIKRCILCDHVRKAKSEMENSLHEAQEMMDMAMSITGDDKKGKRRAV